MLVSIDSIGVPPWRCSEDAAWALGHLGPDACSAAAELLHGDGEAKVVLGFGSFLPVGGGIKA